MNDEGRARNAATDGESAAADPAKRTQAAVGDDFVTRGEVAGQEREPDISSAKKKKGPPLVHEDSDVPGTGGLFAGAAGDATGGGVDELSRL